MTTQSNRVARFVPPPAATPAVDDTVLVSNVVPLTTRWGVGTGAGGAVAEAPQDGTSYVRRNAAWTNILDGGTY